MAYSFNDPKTQHHDGFGDEGQCSAAWIEGSDGTFIQTLLKLGDIEDFHLIAWRSASSDNVIDAMTGPTPAVAGSYFHSGTWDLTDFNGVQVPDGDYVLQLEFTEENSGDGAPWAPGPRKSVPFTLGTGPFDHTPADDGLYDSVRCQGLE